MHPIINQETRDLRRRFEKEAIPQLLDIKEAFGKMAPEISKKHIGRQKFEIGGTAFFGERFSINDFIDALTQRDRKLHIMEYPDPAGAPVFKEIGLAKIAHLILESQKKPNFSFVDAKNVLNGINKKPIVSLSQTEQNFITAYNSLKQFTTEWLDSGRYDAVVKAETKVGKLEHKHRKDHSLRIKKAESHVERLEEQPADVLAKS